MEVLYLMKRKNSFLLLLLLLVFFISSLNIWAEEYRLGPKDVLSIGVWGQPDLQVQQVAILPDGTIFFPLIGQVKVAGMTVEEVQQTITEKLSTYLVNPQISVIVAKTRTIQVKVVGEVNSPGIFNLELGSYASDAIAIAGGPTYKAELAKVVISSPDNPEQIIIALGKADKFKDNLAVGPEMIDGMTVYVPESWLNWEKVTRFSAILGIISAVKSIFGL